MVYPIVKSIAALAVIYGLFYLALKFIKKYSLFSGNVSSDNISPISIKSISYIDNHSKLVKVCYKNKTYILLIGKNSELLIDKFENEET